MPGRGLAAAALGRGSAAAAAAHGAFSLGGVQEAALGDVHAPGRGPAAATPGRGANKRFLAVCKAFSLGFGTGISDERWWI
ncbi:hypothetical protein PR202_ga11431 [Eleusine coracana subsp. coracana]|uniref:Secreted protein n=1 Tax=Eleusine coracana subsp. coracana TaxID=191504 RepID=A0AAV5C9E2_ELECO|nr:hypothetical protein PR202_ga11431 [Eleusine coracana subsp. coracana]